MTTTTPTTADEFARMREVADRLPAMLDHLDPTGPWAPRERAMLDEAHAALQTVAKLIVELGMGADL